MAGRWKYDILILLQFFACDLMASQAHYIIIINIICTHYIYIHTLTLQRVLKNSRKKKSEKTYTVDPIVSRSHSICLFCYVQISVLLWTYKIEERKIQKFLFQHPLHLNLCLSFYVHSKSIYKMNPN